MGMLEQAAAWLEANRSAHLTVPVLYRRKGGGKVAVSAALGRTLFRVEDQYGVTVRTESRDFLIALSELGAPPERGDKIEYSGRLYEVLAPNGEPCWRWSGTAHTTCRIHTKETGEIADG
jgi:hypothetical protein